MSKFTNELEQELVAAVATVLEQHGLHSYQADESEGWDLEMISAFSRLMKEQVAQIERKGLNASN